MSAAPGAPSPLAMRAAKATTADEEEDDEE